MEAIKAVLFEPVGCLAEFRADEFNAAAAALGAPAPDAPGGGSQAYWRLTGLIEQEPERFAAESARLAELELHAIEQADLYPDVEPCLTELRELGIATILASSLSRARRSIASSGGFRCRRCSPGRSPATKPAASGRKYCAMR